MSSIWSESLISPCDFKNASVLSIGATNLSSSTLIERVLDSKLVCAVALSVSVNSTKISTVFSGFSSIHTFVFSSTLKTPSTTSGCSFTKSGLPIKRFSIIPDSLLSATIVAPLAFAASN